MHPGSSPIQGTTSMTSAASLDNSLADMYRSPPRPLPYDADSRYFRLQQRDGLISRHEKGSSYPNEESEPLRGDTDADHEFFSTGGKQNESTCEDGLNEYRSKSSLRLLSAKSITGVGNIYISSDDEDVCPTCLEGILSFIIYIVRISPLLKCLMVNTSVCSILNFYCTMFHLKIYLSFDCSS